MISHFSLTTFVRSASGDLLGEYFHRANAPLNLDAKTPKKRRAEALIEAIEQLDDDRRTAFECDFREVFKLATPAGATCG